MTSIEFRNDPMFLRNQFKPDGTFEMPKIKKDKISLENIELVGYDKLNDSNDDQIVHFFLDDYKFEVMWKDPSPRIDRLKAHKAVLSPNFSVYTEMPVAMKIYNTFRSRWCGAFLQANGIKVIPTLAWGGPETFWFCFDGIEQNSIVAVSTVGVRTEKDLFLQGYNEMFRRLKPAKIICYGKPFPEMKGNIIEVDYAKTNNLEKNYITKYFIEDENGVKGMGSASGIEKPDWTPKKPDDERFIGEPGEIKETYISTKKGGYWVFTKIGKDGKAIIERQVTDHGRPDLHSNPHDQKIIWSVPDGYPTLGPPINYFDGEIPEFKYYKTTGVYQMHENWNNDFKTEYEFKDTVNRGCDLCFEWKGIEYGIFPAENNQWLVCLLGENHSQDVYYDTLDDVINHQLGNDKLIDICTKINVIERNL